MMKKTNKTNEITKIKNSDFINNIARMVRNAIRAVIYFLFNSNSSENVSVTCFRKSKHSKLAHN